jgi:CRP-like cAMP-binding protein
MMLTPPTNPLETLIEKLRATGGLSDVEQHAIRSMPITVREFRSRQDIVQEGGLSLHCCIVLDGWTCCYQILSEGRRQIVSIHVPGDLPDLQSLHLPVTDYGMAALTTANVAFVPHAALQNLIATYPVLSTAFWRETLITAAIQRAWTVGLGRRDARARLAHLLCELHLRLSAVGLAGGPVCPMPLTQVDLADALGTTSVHVSRVLRDLRLAGLINMRVRKLEILDWSGLQAAAEFDRRYLHLPDARRDANASRAACARMPSAGA